jgi:uncharacterized protein YtpQ (UPF0354 family)
MEMLLQARIRSNDEVILNHFRHIKKGDYSYEVRRLLEKAILQEKNQKTTEINHED